jgi:endonuclease/exonuclease/phosphatase family metal-dependent hydrolase
MSSTVNLPELERLSLIERQYVAGGRPKPKYAQLARFETVGGRPLAVVSFHLDTAGGNTHRRGQVEAIAAALVAAGMESRIIAAGDTNAFAITRRRQRSALQTLLEPLPRLGAVDGDQTSPTHFFARQKEPLLTHRITTALGKVGLDLPLRYDVICTDLPVTRRGQELAPESDHDIVWAELDY